MEKIGILSYGCSVNKSDSEAIATLLSDAGYAVVLESEEPDIIIVNSCIVKGPTENKILRKLEDLKAVGKKVIIAGCMAPAYPHILKRFPNFSAIGVNSIDIVETVDEYLQSRLPKVNLSKPDEKIMFKKIRYNPLIDIVPISSGCLGACSYCATRLARGDLRSYRKEKILSEIERSVDSGVKEVWLTSQDNGCYGFDIGTNLATLLDDIVKIPGDFRVRVGMMNPTHVRYFIRELVEAYQNEKIFDFIHLPIQSGSDEVLADMKRGYCVQDFKDLVKRFRDTLPDISLSTDVIVGYPTETDKQFQETYDLIEKLNPDFLNLSKYWPRKKTPAAEYKQLPRELVSERSAKIARLFSKMQGEKVNGYVGSVASVLLTEKRGHRFFGRTNNYRGVLVESDVELRGQRRDVVITKTHGGELISEV